LGVEYGWFEFFFASLALGLNNSNKLMKLWQRFGAYFAPSSGRNLKDLFILDIGHKPYFSLKSMGIAQILKIGSFFNLKLHIT
jgi:hypothetical protein